MRIENWMQQKINLLQLKMEKKKRKKLGRDRMVKIVEDKI